MTGSLFLGSPHRLGRCCLWLAALPFHGTGSAEVLLSHHLPAVSRRTSQEDDMPFHSHLCQVYPRDSCMDFLPLCFRLILTFSYCLYDSLREQQIGTGGSPITDKADFFHGQIRWEKLNVFAPDRQDVRELWAVRPHVILVKVICVCKLHVFFDQYVADIRERKSENIFRTVSTSPLVFNMTVMHRFGAIRISPDVPVGQLQPLTTVVSCTDAGSMVTPFVVPPPPDIEQLCIQLHASLLCCAVYRPLLPRVRCRGSCQSFRRLRFRLTVSSLYEEIHRLRRVRPGCRRRQLTV